MEGGQTILTPPAHIEAKGKAGKAALEGPKTFAFDRSYWSFDRNAPNYAGQENLHEDLGKPLLQNAFDGYNNWLWDFCGADRKRLRFEQLGQVVPCVVNQISRAIGQIFHALGG